MNNNLAIVCIVLTTMLSGFNLFVSDRYRVESLDAIHLLSGRVETLEVLESEKIYSSDRINRIEYNIDDLISENENTRMYLNATDDCQEEYSAKLWELDEIDRPVFDYGIPPGTVVYRAVTLHGRFYYLDKPGLNGTIKCIDITRLKKE